MENKFLITGIGSGLGKYLFENLPNSIGLSRDSFNLIKNEDYDTIVHCAFNKENNITDYYKYLEDNIFLTYNLLKLKYKKFIYISTIDVYPENPSNYGLFKRFAESIVNQYPNITILRCSMILGDKTKPNHVTKLRDNIPSLGLNGESTFNYILNSDILKFIKYSEHPKGVIDFVSNNWAKLSDTKDVLQSSTELGEYIYSSNFEYQNPIHILHEEFNKSSLENLKLYING
jgi:nucleoside-diphosphate-sugar epimerase